MLSDLPTTKDEFGPHKRLANAIADLIVAEEGGKAIALEGGWGSGKSSVIKMLEQRVEEENCDSSSTRLFVYDAWSNEGDPLRRVFLEELTDFCCQEYQPEEKKQWSDNKKKNLTGSIRETQQTATPILHSPKPLLFLTLLSLYPIALASISGLFRQDLKQEVHLWLLSAAIIVAFSMPILMFVVYLYCKLWPTKPTEEKSPQEVKLEHAGRLISLYAKQIDEKVNTTAHESNGPTSIEFQRYFSKMLRSYLREPYRRLVIVLDNLDRVPASTARALWATLRVFAECCEDSRNSSWANRLWFLVPYDPAAASRLWDDGEESKSIEDSYAVKSTDHHSMNHNKDHISLATPSRLSAALLDKTFQIRFDVPPLLLVDWKIFLEKIIRKAFINTVLDEVVMHHVYLLSRQMSQEKRRPPTPRHLKLFVNDIGALHRRFPEFPLDHLALYAILRRLGHDVRLWLLENQHDQETFTALLGSNDYIESLCAMTHGTTDVEKSRDLLLRYPIEDAISTGDAEALVKLSTAPGFWAVLEIVCDQADSEFWYGERQVLNALEAIEKSSLLSETRSEISALKRFLSNIVLQVDWYKLNKVTGEGSARAIRFGLGEDVVGSILSRLVSTFRDESPSSVDVNEWIAGACEVSSALDAVGMSNIFEGHVNMSADDNTADILSAIATLDSQHRTQIPKLLHLIGNIEEFARVLLPTPATEWRDAHSNSIRVLFQVPKTNINYKTVIDALQARLESDGELNPNEIDNLVGTLVDIESIAQNLAIKSITGMVTKGTLFRRLANCQANLNTPTVGHLFRWNITHRRFDNTPSSPTNAPEGFSIAKTIGNSPKEYDKVIACILEHCQANDKNDLLQGVLAEVDEVKPLVAEILSQLIKNARLGSVLDASAFVENVDSLKKACEVDGLPRFDELCIALLKDELFVISLGTLKLGQEDELEGVIVLIANGGRSSSSEFARAIDDYLNTRTVDAWKQSLQTADKSSEMIIALRKVDETFTLAGHFSEAFEQLLSDVLDNSLSIDQPPAHWRDMYYMIPINQLETIASRAIELADTPNKNLVAIIPLFPDHLEKAAIAHSEESFVRNALVPLLRSRDITSLRWLARVVAQDLQCWSHTPQSDQETFNQELSAVLHDSDDSLKEFVIDISNKLGLQLYLGEDE